MKKEKIVRVSEITVGTDTDKPFEVEIRLQYLVEKPTAFQVHKFSTRKNAEKFRTVMLSIIKAYL